VKALMVTNRLAEFASVQTRFGEISKLNIDLTVVSPQRWAGSDHEFRKVVPDGYRLLVEDCWFTRTRSPRLRHHLHFYPGIFRVVRSEKWDLIHIDEEPFNFVACHTLRACRKSDTAVVFTTWQNLMKNYPPPFNFFEKYTFQHSVGAIAGNAEALEVLRRRGFMKMAAHIPQLGVDSLVFRRQEASELRRKLGIANAFVVGFVGRLSPEKGLGTLVKAFTFLPAGCALVLVGNGPERSKIERLARECGVSTRIKWVSRVDSAEIPEYMNAFDVLVLPSRTRWNLKEQFGRVLVEAMACETCVVGSDVGGIPDVIGNAGLVFHEDDEMELAAHLRRLADDISLREMLARRGRERVLSHFAYDKIARATVDFYKRAFSHPAWTRSSDSGCTGDCGIAQESG
jgi:glycosyltransferase involved in cell wall biosynthesis